MKSDKVSSSSSFLFFLPLALLAHLKSVPIFFFNWRIIALQSFVVFCQTSAWVSHRYTYQPESLKQTCTFLSACGSVQAASVHRARRPDPAQVLGEAVKAGLAPGESRLHHLPLAWCHLLTKPHLFTAEQAYLWLPLGVNEMTPVGT